MARYVINKLIEAQKLNKRTGIALSGPPTTIPYQSLLNDVEFDGEKVRFTFMSERFQCATDIVKGFLDVTEGGGGHEPASWSGQTAAAAPSPALAPKIDEQLPNLVFAPIESEGAEGVTLARAKIIGGWLVLSQAGGNSSVIFVPDARHLWSGGSLR